MRRRVTEHPFLLMGVASIPCFVLLAALDLPAGSPALRLLVLLWQTLGFGPYLAANVLARLMPAIPGWLDLLLVALLGATPYLAADRAFRGWRRRRDNRRGVLPEPGDRARDPHVNPAKGLQ